MRFDYLAIITGIFKSNPKNRVNSPVKECTNCGHSQDVEFYFCPNCGQSARPSKITFFSLINELVSNVFNLDTSLYRSFIWLPVPAYLSKKYVKGERKQYLNPIRFFFFSMLLFFALLVGFIDKEDLRRETFNQKSKVEKSMMLDTFNLMVNSPPFSTMDSVHINQIKGSIFKGIVPSDQDSILDFGFDSTSVLDLGGRMQLLRKDLYNKPIDEILEKLDGDSWVSKLAATQILRVTRDISGAVNFLVGNGIWVFIAGIFLLSFVMKMIYFRKKRFFIEHSIILFHTHAFGFAVGILSILTYKYLYDSTSVFKVGLSIFTLYVIISLKYYYGQGWMKTIIKFLVITLFYFFIMSILACIVVLLSLLFFN